MATGRARGLRSISSLGPNRTGSVISDLFETFAKVLNRAKFQPYPGVGRGPVDKAFAYVTGARPVRSYSQAYLAARAANSVPIRSDLRAMDPEQIDGDDPPEVSCGLGRNDEFGC